MVDWIKRHPVLAYYLLVFLISWGGILLILGPGGLTGASQTDQTLLLVVGPLSLLGPGIAGVVLTGLIYGRTGLRKLFAGLTAWRAGIRWYALALLLAPVLMTAVLLAFSLTPAIASADDKLGLLALGIGYGVAVVFLEELGWTGFANPELRKRFGVLTTGLIMGFIWGAWHYPLFTTSAASSAPMAPGLLLAVLLFSWLPPYRVLLVWMYERTHSLLLIMLMHLVAVTAQFVLIPATLAGPLLAAWDLAWGAALWGVVAIVFVAGRSRQLGFSVKEAA